MSLTLETPTPNDNAPNATSPVLPREGFVRLKQILKVLPISHTQLWRMVKDGRFPAPIKLSPQVTVWEANAVRKYIDNCLAQQKDAAKC